MDLTEAHYCIVMKILLKVNFTPITLRCISLIISEPQTSQFLAKKISELMELGWHVKGKYGPLCCLVDLVGPDMLLKQRPDLPLVLLESLSEQTLACYVRITCLLEFERNRNFNKDSLTCILVKYYRYHKTLRFFFRYANYTRNYSQRLKRA